MQSYMMAFHASPVTMRSKIRIEFPKLVKLASSFRFSPNLTLPNRFMPSTAYTKHNRNSNAPMLIKPGNDTMSVLKSISSPLSLRTSRKTRARRSTRSTDAPPPVPAMYPMSVVATQKKSKQFQRSEKYAAGYMAYSLAAASPTKITAKNTPRPSSVVRKSSLASYRSHAIVTAFITITAMMNHSNSSRSTTLYTIARFSSSG